MRRALALATVCLVAFGCGREADNHPGQGPVHAEHDSAGVLIVSNGSPSAHPVIVASAYPTLDVGTAWENEGEGISLFRVVDAALVGKDHIAVADNGRRAVLLVDMQGRLSQAIGRQGQGPGEFEYIAALWAERDGRLRVFDSQLQRLTGFVPSGDVEFTSAVMPPLANPPDPVGILDNDVTVLLDIQFDIPETGFDPMPARLFVFSDGVVTEILETRTGRMGRVVFGKNRSYVTSPIFEAGLKAAAGHESIVVSSCTRPELQQYSPDGTLQSLIRWEDSDRNVEDLQVDLYRRRMLSRTPEGRRSEAAERLDARPIAPEFPTCDRIIAGPTDALFFVRRFPRPEDDHQEWLAFRRGHLAFVVQLDLEAHVLEMSANRVVIVETDDLDVEHVRLMEWVPAEETGR